MSKVEKLIGLTPVLKRLAFHFLKKGLGSHAIEHHLYDEVVVRELYDWNAPNDKMPPQGGIIVEFMFIGERIRFVEFGIHAIGGGGEPIMREV